MNIGFPDRAILAERLAGRGEEILRAVLPRALVAGNEEALAFCVTVLTLRGVVESEIGLQNLREEFGEVLVEAFRRAKEENEVACCMAQIILLLGIGSSFTQKELEEPIERAMSTKFQQNAMTDSEFVELVACMELAKGHEAVEEVPSSGRKSLLKRNSGETKVATFLKRRI